MKKLFKNIEFKPLLVSLGLIIFQSICYAISGAIQGEATLITSSLDESINFNILAIIPYATWYFMLLIVPYIIYKNDKKLLSKYALSYVFVTLVANVIFVCYPTTVTRPTIYGNNILELMTRLIFWIDTPVRNCFPSLHCAMSTMWILYTFGSKKISSHYKWCTCAISITIMIATLFIKQHVIWDLIAGDIIAVIIYYVVKCETVLTKKVNNFFKI